MSVNTYEPAFPHASQEWFNDGGTMRQRDVHWTGMSLRDYFAAKAMSAYLTRGCHSTIPDVAFDSYRVADAMIAAREAQP